MSLAHARKLLNVLLLLLFCFPILYICSTHICYNINSIELAEVLWDMVLRQALMQKGWVGGIALWIIFAFWSGLTIGILVLMEGLSAFLHTLRLHW